MTFDPSPEAMQRNGQQWFPGDHTRIRWWTREGQFATVRPTVPADESISAGTGIDAMWARVGHLDHSIGNGIFAEWVVARTDLGIAVTASKLEVALDGYYRRLMETACAGLGVPLGEALGKTEANAVVGQFSSRNPGFSILSDMERAPIIGEIDDVLNTAAVNCDNIGPMKRSVYARK